MWAWLSWNQIWAWRCARWNAGLRDDLVGRHFSACPCFCRNNSNLSSPTSGILDFWWYKRQTNVSNAANDPRLMNAWVTFSSALQKVFLQVNFPFHENAPVISAPLSCWFFRIKGVIYFLDINYLSLLRNSAGNKRSVFYKLWVSSYHENKNISVRRINIKYCCISLSGLKSMEYHLGVSFFMTTSILRYIAWWI